MSKRRKLWQIGLVLLAGILLVACPVPVDVPEVVDHAAWPEREVTIIVPWAAGGATDLLFRAVVEVFPDHAHGQPLIVKNMPGGGSAVGYGAAAVADPDGYTLVSAVTPIVTRPQMGEVPWHPLTSFAPVILLVKNPCMIIVNTVHTRWHSLPELVEYLREKPMGITLGNPGAGGGNHLVGLKFEIASGTQFTHVPFDGGGPQVTALLGGHIDAATVSAPEGFPGIKAGDLKILAVYAEKRLPEFPDVPTAREQGFDFVASMWRGVAVPAGTDPALIERIRDVFKAVLEDPRFIEDMVAMGQMPMYLGPEEFRSLIQEEYEYYGAAIRAAGLGDLHN
jgi:tripartite-type tricarboxylate transporter receptor subunit TctC